MTSEFKHFFWQQRELERALQAMQPMLDTWSDIPKSLLESVTELNLLRNQFTLPADYLETTSRILDGLAVGSIMESLGCLSSISSMAAEAFQRQQVEIEELSRNLTMRALDLNTALRPMFDSLASTEALLRLGYLDKPWVELALQPQLAFQDFATRHLGLAATDSKVEKQNQFALLDSGSHLLEPMTKGLELATLMRPSSEAVQMGPIREVNVYHTLDDELEILDFRKSKINTASAVKKSYSGIIVDLGARLVKLVYDLNVESEREGRFPVFKPTSKTMMACAVIPTHIACDSHSFEEIVDHLYFLLYEGSGEAARLTDAHDQEELEALWLLKRLRLGARHDLDHESEADAKKKSHQVGEAYLRLIGQVAPRSKMDWMMAQVALYRALVEMLKRVWFGNDG